MKRKLLSILLLLCFAVGGAWLAVGVGDGNATSLREKGIVNSGKFVTATEWYDLLGRHIANGQQPTAKGLYIYNGIKVVINK